METKGTPRALCIPTAVSGVGGGLTEVGEAERVPLHVGVEEVGGLLEARLDVGGLD
jgi:hypothetical protein